MDKLINLELLNWQNFLLVLFSVVLLIFVIHLLVTRTGNLQGN